MRIKPLLLAAAPALTAPAVFAQGVDIHSSQRATFVNGAGEGVGAATDQEFQVLPDEFWTSALTVDLDDRDGVDVVDSTTTLNSMLNRSRLAATLGVRAGSTRGEGDASATAHARFQTTFDVADRVRFYFVGDAFSSDGDAGAAARLAQDGEVQLEVLTRHGGRDRLRLAGWLQPGAFRLDTHATAMVHGVADDEGANLDFSLRFFHAADMNLDGEVARDDAIRFARLASVANLLADFNGDGRVTTADSRGYIDAFLSAEFDRQRGLAAAAEDSRRAGDRDRSRREGTRGADRGSAEQLGRNVQRAGRDGERGAIGGERASRTGGDRVFRQGRRGR